MVLRMKKIGNQSSKNDTNNDMLGKIHNQSNNWTIL